MSVWGIVNGYLKACSLVTQHKLLFLFSYEEARLHLTIKYMKQSIPFSLSLLSTDEAGRTLAKCSQAQAMTRNEYAYYENWRYCT